MDSRRNHSGIELQGRIDKRTHSVKQLRETYRDWDKMSKEQRLKASRAVEPVDEETVYNVTTDRFHEYFVDNLDPEQNGAKDERTAAWLGLGTNSGGGTSTSDIDLNTRVYEETVTDHADNGKELVASTFVDSSEANGNTLNELGLFTGNPDDLSNEEVFLINHATFADVTKDNTRTVTFDVTLSFSDL